MPPGPVGREVGFHHQDAKARRGLGEGNGRVSSRYSYGVPLISYRQYSKDHVDDEAAARDARVGMWRGEFVPPWEWRRK